MSGTVLPQRKHFQHAHAPRHPARECLVEGGSPHGNYPWVGSGRQALGRSTNVDEFGAQCVRGIGPSDLYLHGMGGIEEPTRRGVSPRACLFANLAPQTPCGCSPAAAARRGGSTALSHLTFSPPCTCSRLLCLIAHPRRPLRKPAPGPQGRAETEARVRGRAGRTATQCDPASETHQEGALH